jgi:hypothetical protein
MLLADETLSLIKTLSGEDLCLFQTFIRSNSVVVLVACK